MSMKNSNDTIWNRTSDLPFNTKNDVKYLTMLWPTGALERKLHGLYTWVKDGNG
jgi:hypothetical protein